MIVKETVVLILVSLCQLYLTFIIDDGITISTKLGRITGKTVKVMNGTKNVYHFLNIPFAKPPIGNLRFAKPQKYGGWHGTRHATKYGPVCIQPPSWGYRMSEDCLQLNIFIPNDINKSNSKSVMVWIHGGGFFTGSAIDYDGSMLAATGDVIVVTTNYRLGIFGFITFKNTLVRGNYGLWDQIFALEWVKENIKDYGGNSDDITIFGESAGGWSVGLQTLIPSNKGLFHRAIAQSGVGNTYVTITNQEYITSISIEIGNSLKCVTDSTRSNLNQTVECMRGLSAFAIQNATMIAALKNSNSEDFVSGLRPIVDGELFTKPPAELLYDNTSFAFQFYQSLDMLIGNCDMEGTLFLLLNPKVQKQYHFNISTGIPTTYLCNGLAPALSAQFCGNKTEVSDAICKEYRVMNDPALQSRQVLELYSDIFFIAPTVASLDQHSKSNAKTNAYHYIFSQIADVSNGPFPLPSYAIGVSHGSDLIYLFYLETIHTTNPKAKITDGDRLLAKYMREYWTNFAKTGNPNSADIPVWPKYTSAQHAFLQLNSTNMTSAINYRDKYTIFWLKTIPNLV